MNQIEKLIEELCPNGVEYKPLGELTIALPGLKGKKKTDFSNGNAPFISYKNVFSNISTQLDSSDYVKVGNQEKQNHLLLGDILITGSSESTEDVGLTSVVTKAPSKPIYLNSFCFILRPISNEFFNPDFAKHLFRSEYIRQQIRRCSNGVTRINISKPRLARITIPVPPLEIQNEIVKILDTFQSLEAELEAELEA
ncbi:restriction endonuclease subunit S, partial [Corynebacterium sp. HMSC072B09]